MFIVQKKDFFELRSVLSAMSFSKIEQSVKSRFLFICFLFFRLVKIMKRYHVKEYLADSIVLRRFLVNFFWNFSLGPLFSLYLNF